jgi:isopentenyldiphosphate isomerase
VDHDGRPAGSAPRGECHGNPALIQAVVHLWVFDGAGRMYLQRRARSKELYPGRWDTAVGGHMGPGESPEQALRREAREELGPELARAAVPPGLEALEPYLYRDARESEYVFPFRLLYGGPLRPDPQELAEGRFFSAEELERGLSERPGEFTPHFRAAYRHLRSGEERR